MTEDKYIEIKDLEKENKKEKVRRFFGGIKEGAQKVGGAVSSTVKTGVQKHQEYKEKEPERRAERIEKLKIQEKTLLEKKKESDLRERVQKLQNKTRPNMDGLNKSMGFMMGRGGLMQMENSRPVNTFSAPKPKSSKKFTVINGKAYEIAGASRRVAPSNPKPKTSPAVMDPFSIGQQRQSKKNKGHINPFGF